MLIARLLLVATLVAPARLNATVAAPTGLFVATLLNSHPLPRIERVEEDTPWRP